jgi:hypothetical protein
VGFVNLDSDVNVGQQSHIQALFGASGAQAGTPGFAITIPAAVLFDGATPHFITALQRRFRNDPAGEIAYIFHPDATGVLRSVTSTVLTGATGTVVARVGADPLVIARTAGSGRVVHFGTLEYLRADRFGFLMGMDDIFWRSLVWAARKPFVVRGYPRLWALQMDDTLPGWATRVRDLYDTTLTGEVAPDGTGGPWRVTGYAFIDFLQPGSAERAQMIEDINAGFLQVSPHSRREDYGGLYWEDPSGQPLTETSWLATVADIQTWIAGNGGADTVPNISRSMLGHFWNLSNLIGYDLWNTLGFRYIMAIQRPGVGFYAKTDADRLRLRPFRLYELPPASFLDENYPIYFVDDFVVNSRTGLPPQTFVGFTTQIIDLARFDRQDVGWPNSDRPPAETIDHFQYYTWRLWSSLAPVNIYTHDGSSNYILSTSAQRRQVVQDVSTWLNANGVRHVFMEDLGDYLAARMQSTLVGAALVGGALQLTFTGDATTAEGIPLTTELLFYTANDEGSPIAINGFTGGTTVTVTPPSSNPVPAISGLTPETVPAGSSGFTLTVVGSGFMPTSVVRWNGTNRVTTYTSATQLTAVIPAADVATIGTATVTVFTPAPGGGTSNAQPFTISGSFVPTLTALTPSSAVAGGSGVTLLVTGTNFVPGSVVRWNGTDRATTYVSATQLEAAISAADIATAGAATVTVFTPPPGGGTSNAQTFTTMTTGSSLLLDDFNRPANAVLGNGWVEKTPAAFALTGTVVSKAATGTGFADNLVYRPVTEVVRDGEASVEFRVASLPPGYPQVFVRGQTATISNAGIFDGYLLFVDNNPGLAIFGRLNTGSFTVLAQVPLAPGLNTTDTYRLRLRAMGTDPVVVTGVVERYTGSGWVAIGQATANDTAATRYTTAGTVGFSGFTEGGIYTYDNFTRLNFDAGATNPAPTLSGLTPTTVPSGSGSLTLLVTGTNFVPGSVVRWNGADRVTTYGSATQMTAVISAADVATAGTAAVTVFTPAPEGGTSNALPFTISGSLVPTLTALTPSSAVSGGSGVTLQVTGTNFVPGSVVRWNGTDRGTTYLSATQLEASISASDIATAGTATVTVFTPPPGGGTSNAQTFTILATSLLMDDFNRPANAVLGNGWVEKTPAAFALTGTVVSKAATGTGFTDNLVYRPVTEAVRDVEASVEFRVASLPPGYPQVFVRGQTATIGNAGIFDGYLLFVDNNPTQATLSRLNSSSFTTLSQLPLAPGLNTTDTYRLRLRAVGTDPVVVTGVVERYTGSGWVAIGQATANDTAATRFITAGTVGFSGHTEGGIYTYDNFTLLNFDAGATNPAPTLSGLTPPTVPGGSSGVTLLVTGTNFVPGSVVRWNGTDRVTTYWSATQMTAVIPATDVATAGTATVTVFTPAPGGGTSNAQTFTMTNDNPVPVLTALTPSSVGAGSGNITLLVTGTNFMPGSIVRWNGANRTTTYVSATQLEATISAADVATAGAAAVTVFTAAPGGGLSNAIEFNIILPGSSFFDDFNRSDNAVMGNGWTEKFPAAFAIQNNEVVGTDTFPFDYHDTIVYRPVSEDRRDVEVGIEFRILPGVYFPQVHARVQRNTIAQPDTLEGYIFFVDGFAPAPGQAIIAVQPPVTDQYECYMLAIPFPSALQASDRYRLRFRVTGVNPVVLTGTVERLVGTSWQLFASGTINHDNTTQRNPNLFCAQTAMPAPILNAGAVGFAKWTTNNEVLDNFFWTDLTGQNPTPLITSLSPDTELAGSAAFTLTVNGTDFTPNSLVRWNGVDRTTTYVSTTRLLATIPSGDIAAPGTAQVTVFTPGPGGGTSNIQPFTIVDTNNPVPVVTALSPATAPVGTAGLTLTVIGTGFINGSVIRWNGSNRVTTFVSPTQLTANLPAADFATAGTAAVTVFTPAPGGGTSNAQPFDITVVPPLGSVTVTFDNPVPPGSSGNLLAGNFGGVNFGTNQWRWESPFGVSNSNHIFFDSATGTSRTFAFTAGTAILESVRAFTLTQGTLTISDNQGQIVSQVVAPGVIQLVQTGWTQRSTTVTVNFSAGWDLGLDDIVYRE